MSVQLRSSSGFQSRLLCQGINNRYGRLSLFLVWECGAETALLLQNPQTNRCVVAENKLLTNLLLKT